MLWQWQLGTSDQHSVSKYLLHYHGITYVEILCDYVKVFNTISSAGDNKEELPTVYSVALSFTEDNLVQQ